MCGIVGFLRLTANAEPLDEHLAAKMCAAISRRGPDAEGQWRSSDGGCWLGFRRLAIIDLQTGDQPMTNEDGTLWVVYNGEIYNYKSLRSELAACGHLFKTSSDTEVLLHGFEQWGGEGLLKKLRGIFAFAIYDTAAQTLFLARDHLGVKPLFWWTDGEVFLFGSEIKAMLPHPGLRRRTVNRAGVAQFLVSRYVSRPNTMFEGIYKLPEAHFLTVTVGDTFPSEPKQYWDVSYRRHEPAPTFAEAVERLDALLKETVEMQLMSDVPLGAQLSGGVDSSVIVALMDVLRKESGQRDPVKTFSVGFDVEKFSELPHARAIAERYKTEHHEIHCGFDDFIQELPMMCWLYDEPIGEPPAIPTYLMCKRAKEFVTVMLCGEGADEQFGGYLKYAFDHYSRYIDWMPAALRKKLLRGLAALLPFRARRLRTIIEILGHSDEAERFASWYGALDPTLLSGLLEPKLESEVGAKFLEEVFRKEIAKCDSDSKLSRFLYCDIHTRLVDDLLVKGDRMSMGASIEARVPFLDHHVVEFAARLPDSYKVKGLRTKIILKKLAERYAPHDQIYRRKVGFVVPLSSWFIGPLKDFVRDILLSERCLSRGYYRPDILKKMVEEQVNAIVDREQGIWVMLALEIWHRLYVDDDGSEASVERVKEDLFRSFTPAGVTSA